MWRRKEKIEKTIVVVPFIFLLFFFCFRSMLETNIQRNEQFHFFPHLLQQWKMRQSFLMIYKRIEYDNVILDCFKSNHQTIKEEKFYLNCFKYFQLYFILNYSFFFFSVNGKLLHVINYIHAFIYIGISTVMVMLWFKCKSLSLRTIFIIYFIYFILYFSIIIIFFFLLLFYFYLFPYLLYR